jgi:large subunit ribosomal protein L24
MFIHKDDMVEVITGDDKGSAKQRRVAKVLRVLPARKKIVVEGINRVYKHLKPSQKNQQGGRLSKEMPIHVSNVMLYCQSCGRGVRVGHRFTDSGQKQRYCQPGQRRPGQAQPRQVKARCAQACSASLSVPYKGATAPIVKDDRRWLACLNNTTRRSLRT